MSGTKDFRDDHAFLFWMAMSRLDMVVNPRYGRGHPGEQIY